MEDHELAAIPVCRRLRTKIYYVIKREHVNLRISSPTAQYWCASTTTVMGPNNIPYSPKAYQPHRPCFETE